MATRGPAGGGHLPRAFSAETSSGDIVKSIAERFQDVPVTDRLRPFQIRGRPRYPPCAVKPSRGQSLLLGPALESAPGTGLEQRHLAQSFRFQLGVEAALPIELSRPGRKDAFAHRGRRFASRLRGELGERHAADSHLEVDAVEERSGQAPLVSIDQAWGAAAGPRGVAEPPTRTWIGRGDQREPSWVRD